ncbi:MAG: DNA-protecting protein DprA [Fimbriimonadaceae bacterium]|nr:DNA-protecting protein DprA [Fimbriimonadaceae bacterium]
MLWQHLLAVDPAGTRFPDLLEGLGTFSSTAQIGRLKADGRLTPADRSRLDKIHQGATLEFAERGGMVLSAEDLGLEPGFGLPGGLFALGDPQTLAKPRLAIVGTRTASTYGKACAAKFAEHLGAAGFALVSGGAFGIDAAVHQASLSAGVTTHAVLPVGLDRWYPASNGPLFERIVEQGLVFSQFPLGMTARVENFLQRNHTIAGLVDAVLIIEAPETSGALYTARAAAEMGREVFVVPGQISTATFRGSHALIRDGATLCDHPDQILEQLGITMPSQAEARPDDPILAALAGGALRSDALGRATGLNPADLASRLTDLELDGLIISGPDGYALRP